VWRRARWARLRGRAGGVGGAKALAVGDGRALLFGSYEDATARRLSLDDSSNYEVDLEFEVAAHDGTELELQWSVASATPSIWSRRRASPPSPPGDGESGTPGKR
jgi:hypothetical protein